MLTIEDLELDASDIRQDASDFAESVLDGEGIENIVLIMGQLDPLEQKDGASRWTADQMVLIEQAREVLGKWENPEA